MIGLRGAANFARVLKSGDRYSDHVLALRALRRPLAAGRDAVRVGVTVGRRLGSAVHRNRIRRWVRESARAVLQGVAGGWDLVFIPRDGARTVTHDQLRESISRLVRRAGISGHDE